MHLILSVFLAVVFICSPSGAQADVNIGDITLTADRIYFRDDSSQSTAIVRGPKGPKGDTGSSGAQGAKGERGDARTPFGAPCQTGQVNIQTATGFACGEIVPLPDAIGACVNGDCSLSCVAGKADCDHVVENGCENDITIDRDNCGACGHACTGGYICADSACALFNPRVEVLLSFVPQGYTVGGVDFVMHLPAVLSPANVSFTSLVPNAFHILNNTTSSDSVRVAMISLDGMAVGKIGEFTLALSPEVNISGADFPPLNVLISSNSSPSQPIGNASLTLRYLNH